jgi:hypothetical protein
MNPARQQPQQQQQAAQNLRTATTTTTSAAGSTKTVWRMLLNPAICHACDGERPTFTPQPQLKKRELVVGVLCDCN